MDNDELTARIERLEAQLESIVVMGVATMAALRTLIKAHPDRVALRHQWDQQVALLWPLHAVKAAGKADAQTERLQKHLDAFQRLMEPQETTPPNPDMPA